MAEIDRTLEQAPADWLRPSSFIIALGVGLGAAFSAPSLEQGVVRGFSWFGWSLAGIFAVPAILWLLHRVVDLSDRLRDLRAGANEAGESEVEAPTVTVSPLVQGGLLTDLERHVQDGLLLTLRHGQAAGTLRSTKLIPTAFVDYEHWRYWADVLASAGLADKQNGVATELARGRTWTWARRQVLNGNFDAPALDVGASLPRLPHPFSVSVYAEVEVE